MSLSSKPALILSAHQPAYLPWLGYFDKISKSDLFVFLDNVQFEKNSFINRNKIKTPQGPIWLTIPVKMRGHTASTLAETEIDNRQPWISKHLKSIFINYKKAPHFEENYPKLEALYSKKHDLLSDLCFEQLQFWLIELKINKKIVRSTSLGIQSHKSDLVLDLCAHFKASHYISGVLGRDYLEEPKFSSLGISIEYQEFLHPQYPQLYGDFLPAMGIVDFWMNSHLTIK